MPENRNEQFFTDLPLIHPLDALLARLGLSQRWNDDAPSQGDDGDAAGPGATLLLRARRAQRPERSVRLDWNS
jgi:hypothetical protein